MTSTPLRSIPTPGSIVRARGREWITLPQSGTEKQSEVLKLRPLGGGDQQIATLYWPLEGGDLCSAEFEPPDPTKSGSQRSALLLRDALLLKLRAGAGPFRSLGNLAFEPRAYQLVPLLMALKQAVTRVLIADEVGLGKTVEALLIARELLDRGEIRQVTVICPPHLCEKWRQDMATQFNLSAEVVRPGTAAKLERGIPMGRSIFEAYPFTVVSLDYIKSDRNREGFLRACGDFVIVDEAHTCAAGKGRSRHQRFNLLRGLAAEPTRHLVLLTATPHSGDKEAFDNLLGLLNQKFAGLGEMPDGPRRSELRDELGDHFVQRRRQDLKTEWGTEGADFPDRETREATYTLDGEWGALFQEVLDYARELVRRSASASRFQQRMSWWAALALLRCVSSSPAAAASSLRTKLLNLQTSNGEHNIDEAQQLEDLEALAGDAVLDGSDEALSNEEAAPGSDLSEPADAAQLNRLIQEAERLQGPKDDPKLRQLIKELKGLLKEGFRPVIFCRYRPTAHYLKAQLEAALPSKPYAVAVVTGELPPEERVVRIRALEQNLGSNKTPILIATDCLSEGIDLQRSFDAVVHYDLCWNPTRHEQREGRVDRFGQQRSAVRALMLHGGDSNPVDERVRSVILEKEKTIRKELGVSVPIPGNANTITQAVLSSILGEREEIQQLGLELGLSSEASRQLDLDAAIDAEWESAKEKARQTQTIFAQRRLQPEEVLQEWRRTKESLGNHEAVERFVVNAADALKLSFGEQGARGSGLWELNLSQLEASRIALRERLSSHDLSDNLRVCFSPPFRDGAELVHRSHPLVMEFADFLAERALSGLEPNLAARSSVIRTNAVATRTQLLMVRLRHQLSQERWNGNSYDTMPPLLVEECLTVVVSGQAVKLIQGEEALALLQAKPIGNVVEGQREQWLQEAIKQLPTLRPALETLAHDRASVAVDDHRRVRQASLGRGEALRMRFSCEPTLPVDVIGLFLLLPAPVL